MILSFSVAKWKLLFFLVALLFLRFPPVYMFPLIKSAYLTTQALSRVIIVGLFVFESRLLLIKKGQLGAVVQKNKLLVGLVVLYFFQLSTGIFYAISVGPFLMRYKDVVVSLMLFFLAALYKDKVSSIYKIITVGILASFAYQFLVLVWPSFFSTVASIFVYDKHLVFVQTNIERGRIYVETIDEALVLLAIPFLLAKFKNSAHKLSLALLLVTGFFAFVSNFRTRILLFGISVIGALVYFVQKNKRVNFKITRPRTMLFVVSSLVVSVIIAEVVAFGVYGFSFIDRLTFADRREDVQTVYFRAEQLNDAYRMSKNNFFSGVGLGNFYDSLPSTKVISKYATPSIRVTEKGAAEYVHNLFGTLLAEGGLWSLMIMLALTVVFLRDDVRSLKQKQVEETLVIFAFWGVYVYALLHPFVPLTLQGMFWFTRGLLLKS